MGQESGAVACALGADDRGRHGLGQLAAVVGLVAVVDVDAGDDLGGSGVRGGRLGMADAAASHGLEQAVGAGVVGGGLAAPHDGLGRRPAAGAPPTAGMRAVSSVALKCRAIRGD